MNSSVGEDTDSGPSAVSMMSIVRAAHALEDRIEAALASAGLSSPKLTVLTELVKADKPLSLSELANRVSCVRSNMTQLVDRLEADGLVARVDDPEDRRAVRAAITDEGRKRQVAGSTEISRLEAEFAGTLTGQDRSALARVLRQIG